MGGGDRRDREDRSDEYRDREPDDESVADAQERLDEAEAVGEGASESGSGRSGFHPGVESAAESALQTIRNPEDTLDVLSDKIDFSVLNGHVTETDQGRMLNAAVQGWLIEERGHSGEEVISPAGEAADGFQEVGFWWDKDGYRSEGVQPIWDAAENITERDTEVGETVPLSLPGQTVDYNEEMTKISESIIGFSQAFAAEHLADENGEITVHRKWRDDMAEKARRAKEAGEDFEVVPRTLESATLSFEKLAESADESEPIVTRTISVEDVGVYLAAVAPGHAQTEEITTLGNETYSIPADQITIVTEDGE